MIVWPDFRARQRRELLGSRLLVVDGKWEKVDGVGELIAARLHDLSGDAGRARHSEPRFSLTSLDLFALGPLLMNGE